MTWLCDLHIVLKGLLSLAAAGAIIGLMMLFVHITLWLEEHAEWLLSVILFLFFAAFAFWIIYKVCTDPIFGMGGG